MKFSEHRMIDWFVKRLRKYPFLVVTGIKYPRPEQVDISIYGTFCRISLKSKKIALWGFKSGRGSIKFEDKYS